MPDMSAARFKRNGRGSELRPLTRRITNRIVSDALRYEVSTPVATVIASLIAVGSKQFEPLLHYLRRGLS